MSRYIIPSKSPLEYFCSVGYDNPLQTFFAHVGKLAAEDDEDETLFVNGQLSGEINSVDKLQESISQYADIPPYIREQLDNDKLNSPGPNAFQKRMINLVEGLINAKKQTL